HAGRRRPDPPTAGAGPHRRRDPRPAGPQRLAVTRGRGGGASGEKGFFLLTAADHRWTAIRLDGKGSSDLVDLQEFARHAAAYLSAFNRSTLLAVAVAEVNRASNARQARKRASAKSVETARDPRERTSQIREEPWLAQTFDDEPLAHEGAGGTSRRARDLADVRRIVVDDRPGVAGPAGVVPDPPSDR